MPSRNDHRDGVVMARVAVEDDGQTPTFGMMLVGWCHDHQSMPPLPSGREIETLVRACARHGDDLRMRGVGHVVGADHVTATGRGARRGLLDDDA